eukprot:scaffold31226_cov28-Tisochrysis_lutea.AAC.1
MTFGSSQDAPNDGTTPNNIKDHFFLLEVWVILGAYSAHSMGMLYVMYVMVLIRNVVDGGACRDAGIQPVDFSLYIRRVIVASRPVAIGSWFGSAFVDVALYSLNPLNSQTQQ